MRPSAHWALKGHHATGGPAGGASPHDTRGRGASTSSLHHLSRPWERSAGQCWGGGGSAPDTRRRVPGSWSVTHKRLPGKQQWARRARDPAKARMGRPAPPTRSQRPSPESGPAHRASAACGMCVGRGRAAASATLPGLRALGPGRLTPTNGGSDPRPRRRRGAEPGQLSRLSGSGPTSPAAEALRCAHPPGTCLTRSGTDHPHSQNRYGSECPRPRRDYPRALAH